jgi:hypothetical protein
MSDYSMIVGDDDLCVFVDWSDPTAPVYFRYGWNDQRNTGFQTADFAFCGIDEILGMVETYAENLER